MIDEAREKLKEFKQQTGKTQAQIAKELNVSETVVSGFLTGKYKGDMEHTAAIVLSYIESGTARRIAAKAPEYYPELKNSMKVEFAARYAHSNNSISLVYGAAGSGKTTALKHYTAENPGVIYIAANAATRTGRAVLYTLLEEMGMKPTGTEFQLMRSLVDKLKDTNRLVIIDEADHLSFRCLQEIRNLNDEAGIGLVLSGNDIIKHQMYGRGMMQYDQLRTRVGMEKVVSNTYTPDEMRALFPALDDKCIQYLMAIAHKESLRTAISRYIFTINYCVSCNIPVTFKAFKDTERTQLEGLS
ncbi:AAA family ATPase [Ruminococcus sp.]|uniref:AAA family ATPase n=1 Tax=Ruminococcus sp. TaxID=41978 RepID=UPI0025F19935|nr:AAA family ATPase [Ruminococcus sp.]MBR1430173.1 AAA family ATPase [Ruminococcus sp.]